MHNVIIDKERNQMCEAQENLQEKAECAFVQGHTKDNFIVGYGREVRKELTKDLKWNPIN